MFTKTQVELQVLNYHFIYNCKIFNSHYIGYVTAGPFNDDETVTLIQAIDDSPAEREKGQRCFLRAFGVKAYEVEFTWPEVERTSNGFATSYAKTLIKRGEKALGQQLLAEEMNSKTIEIMHSIIGLYEADLRQKKLSHKEYVMRLARLLLETKAALL